MKLKSKLYQSNIAHNLRRARLEQELTQEDLATAAKVSPGLIEGIEQGLRMPSVWTLIQLATALDVDLDWLIFFRENPQ